MPSAEEVKWIEQIGGNWNEEKYVRTRYGQELDLREKQLTPETLQESIIEDARIDIGLSRAAELIDTYVGSEPNKQVLIGEFNLACGV